MPRVWPPLLVLAALGSPVGAAEPADHPLFSRHIVPLLSRLGCNAGACHGSVKGQNGFRLSLFGADPALDHAWLVREFGGRRLNEFEPDKSLLLEKATGVVSHVGGQRMSANSREYKLLRNWLAGGAALDKVANSRVTALRVTPTQQTLHRGQTYALKVEAAFADGTTEDVTGLCSFEALDQVVAAVDGTGTVTAKGVGDAALVVRYGYEPAVAHLVVPRAGPEPFPEVKPNNFVDAQVLAKLKRLNIHPAGPCDDATFLRRTSLDVTGLPPTADEVRAFLADPAADKRAKKIDDLLGRPGYAALWATKFSDVLKPNSFNANYGLLEAAEARRFYEWVRARMSENTPYDEFAARVLLATSRDGRAREEWIEEVMALAAENARMEPDLTVYAKRKTLDLYWQRENATGVKGALQVAHAFLGLRLECAQCHRHPHDVWQQDDLLSFANFFMRVKGANYPDSKSLPVQAAELTKKGPEEAKRLREDAKKLTDKAKDKSVKPADAAKMLAEARELETRARVLTEGPKRFGTEVQHNGERASFATVSSPLGTQKSEAFRLLGSKEVLRFTKEDDPRAAAVAWMREPDNPYFAKAVVNRVWAHYFGRGIIDPADHLSSLNPPSHPELLDALAKGFVESKYDLKWLHKTILSSRTYQQSAKPHETAKGDRRNFASFPLRRLPAEVLLDAINQAAGATEAFPPRLFLPAGARAMEVAGVTGAEDQRAALAYAFQIFGRPARNGLVQCDCEREQSPTIVQALYLANHPHLRDKIAGAGGRVARLVADVPDDAKRIEEVFLWTVGRPPSKNDLAASLEYVKTSPTARSGLEDLMWSLINTREFSLNH
ncbi:MAG: DUF1553 domain-containing protein [Gemmata sp.]